MAKVFREWEFLDGLSADLRSEVEGAAATASFPAGRLIQARGDRGSSLCIVKSGAARMSNVGRDGKRITTAVLQPGEAFGALSLFAGYPRSHDCHAVGGTRLLVLSRRRFEGLMDRSPALRNRVIAYLARRLMNALDALEDERRLPLPVRLGKCLLERSSSENLVKITQMALAQELAVSRFGITLALRRLRERGWVVTGYGALQIANRGALENWVARASQLEGLEN